MADSPTPAPLASGGAGDETPAIDWLMRVTEPYLTADDFSIEVRAGNLRLLRKEIQSLRVALAENERLRRDTERLDLFERWLIENADFAANGQADARWPRIVLTNHPDSAGIQANNLREAIDDAEHRWPRAVGQSEERTNG